MNNFNKIVIATVICGGLSACLDKNKKPGTVVPAPNVAPVASAVNITDDNAGEAEVGDGLSGSYTYSDTDNDAEGTTTFQWRRDGAAITSATGSSYTLTTADAGTEITFEVTPIAASGSTNGSAETSAAITVNAAPVNQAPIASEVSISDDNAGEAQVGDALTGSYTYADTENDVEGSSTFQWLRNNVAIAGANSLSYTMVAEDVPAQINFEVTPVAASGALIGNAVSSAPLETGTAPVVIGFARFLDTNHNGVNDAGDELIVPFDQDLNINLTDADSFVLPVMGNTFGNGASVSSGPSNHEATITMGMDANLKTRQDFVNGVTNVDSASSIDVSASLLANAIEGLGGVDALPSTAIDLIPGSVDSAQLLGSNESWFVALGDVDGDGDSDMVIANDGEGNLVYSNDGAGLFTDSGQSLGASNISRSIALGDVDGDGDTDIVVANDGQGNRVYLNDGSGAFSDSGQDLGLNESWSVVLGDVDGDGDMDMLVANYSGQGNRVYYNDGAGLFTDSGQSIGGSFSLSVALGDLDNDGDLDMAVANIGQANRVYYNDGTGIFTDSGQALATNDSVSLALGDVDGDSDLDILVANFSGQANRVYLNDGAGVFTGSGQTLGAGTSRSVALSDVDGDGDIDVVVANSNDEANLVYYNDGTGLFVDGGQALGTSSSVAVALGDVEGDGDIDMVVANVSAQGNQVYFNSLSGTEGVAYVYSNDFESNAEGFSTINTGNLPNDAVGGSSNWLGGDRALANSSTTLTLTQLTPGQRYYLAFDLYIGGTWDGSGTFGPDFFTLSSSSAGVLVSATFVNDFPIGGGSGKTQTYSDQTPLGDGGEFIGRTGADVILGEPIYYFGHGAGNPALSFVATSATEILTFTANNAEFVLDEFIALDNVVVSDDPALLEP